MKFNHTTAFVNIIEGSNWC